MPREGGASSNHNPTVATQAHPFRCSRLLDRPPEFIIGPRFARTRWRAMTTEGYPDPEICLRLIRRTTHQIASTATGTNSAVASVTSTGTPSSCSPFIR